MPSWKATDWSETKRGWCVSPQEHFEGVQTAVPVSSRQRANEEGESPSERKEERTHRDRIPMTFEAPDPRRLLPLDVPHAHNPVLPRADQRLPIGAQCEVPHLIAVTLELDLGPED